MRGRLIYKAKKFMPDGAIKEVKVWKVPVSSAKPHGIKYSFVYIVDGRRVIGYDNAEGKGDHRHYYELELPYKYQSLEKLWADFHADIARYQEEKQ
jgi:hypothetical protein